jgi:P-type Cu2+ transporter
MRSDPRSFSGEVNAGLSSTAFLERSVAALGAIPQHRQIETPEVRPADRRSPDDYTSMTLLVENLHCAGCIALVERTLLKLPGVAGARVNFSTRRVHVRWRKDELGSAAILSALDSIGYPSAQFNAEYADRTGAQEERDLLRCLAVAGFAAANIMLLSVSVWAGAAGDMSSVTRELFHWVSALLAIPAVAYAGRPFFRSGWAAVIAGRLNMDVPISLAVLLSVGMSIVESVRSGPHAYFDAAVMLLFFLLVGRYLDRRMRSQARSAAERLLSLKAEDATVVDGDGQQRRLPASEISPGMKVLIAAGERVPVDGIVETGRTDLDTSLVTGEAAPESVSPGDRVFAGTLNLTGALTIRVLTWQEDTLLAEIARMVECAEQARSRFTGIADRVSRIYSPAVHIIALSTFLAWWLVGGLSAWSALTISIAVLIITCPCAVGLAVPAVQVIAVDRLFRSGILVKSGNALERLSGIDMVVLDKTGTLTVGRPAIADLHGLERSDLEIAATLAARSMHPLAQALAASIPSSDRNGVTGIEEFPGLGLKGNVCGIEIRLGSREFCGVRSEDIDDAMEIWYRIGAVSPQRIRFSDQPRVDAGKVVADLKSAGLHIVLLSGDRESVVEHVAMALGIDEWHSRCKPADKVRYLEAKKAEGRRIMMVGDGINDAPALATASVGMSPASAAAVSQVAADLIFLGDRLSPVSIGYSVAKYADRIVRQNFMLAIGYNAIAVPVAIAGFATPLIAAIAMSMSSVLVILNALRVRGASGLNR